MRIGFYAAALSSIQEEKRLNVIANNLANATTPGYKKDSVLFKDFLFQSTSTQMDQGRIHPTGNPLDIALSGGGFLSVETDQGIQYTRAGNLTIDKENTLVTPQGWPVMGQNGPIRITRSSEVRIEKDGQVFDENNAVDTLNIVQFPDGAALEKTDNGYFKLANGQPEPIPAEKCTVEQGALEEANFNIVEEMAHMIESTRAFEAYQKVIQLHDERDNQITNKLGNG